MKCGSVDCAEEITYGPLPGDQSVNGWYHSASRSELCGSVDDETDTRVATPTLDWTMEDHIAANREGWDLFDCDGSENGPLQLCKIDEPELWAEERDVTIERTWQEDNEAWVFVWTNPSGLHAKALAIVKAENPTEYEAIEQWVAKASV